MEKCFKAFDQLDSHTGFLPWAYTILRNSFIDLKRTQKGKSIKSFNDLDSFEDKKGFTRNELDVLVDKNPSPYESSVIEEKFRFTMQAISQLKPTQRDILNMVSTGSSYDEVATELNLKKGTVMSTLCRAREMISEKWERHLEESES
jgi:RNA polymerase sigma factor (sigma-70 family)